MKFPWVGAAVGAGIVLYIVAIDHVLTFILNKLQDWQ